MAVIRSVLFWRRRNCGAPLSGGMCLRHKTVPKQERGRSGAGASSCACLRRGIVSSKSNGMQERQRHRRSVSRLRSVSVSGAAGGLRVSVMGVCAVGGSSKRGVAGKERLSARASVKLR